ncbi:MAG: M15 family metallopeptidase [Eubacterium sp.]|nr:M15 family metallopeptidase [Eubacterium sp.]
MNKKKAIQITAIVLSVILVSAIVISLAVRNNLKEQESSTNPISSSTTEKPSTSETPSAKPSEESTSQENTESTSKNKKPSSNGVDILVNAKNPIPDDWSVNLVQLKNGHQIDKRAYDSLQKMMDDARAKGWNPLICSSYRTTSYQQQLFDNRVQRMKNQGMSEKEAIKDTEKWIAIPGTSEHETGLAVDIVTVENQNLDNSQLNSDCQKWMMEHCYDYGFILRYPEDKVSVTGIDFEPWHYRYVGYDIAQYIKQKGICLEEYKSN